MNIKVFVIAVILTFLGFLSVQAQGQPCGCADKQDLLNLLNQTQMALQESQFQMDLILAKDGADGKPSMATSEGVNRLHQDIHNAAKKVLNKNYPGHAMDVTDCTVKRTSTFSDCVELVEKHFYDIPQKACLANKSARGSDQAYYEKYELTSYLFHIMSAYNAKREFILRMLNSLPKDCRPNNWFGYVTYQKVRTVNTVKTILPYPGTGLGGNGGSETSAMRDTFDGRVLVEDGKASGSAANATYTSRNDYAASARVRCTMKEPIGVAGTNTNRSDLVTGDSNGDAEFSVNVNPGMRTYGLSASFPPITMTGQTSMSSTTTAAGGCRAAQRDNSGPLTMRTERVGHFVSGKKLTSPDYLEGSEVVRPPLANQTSKIGLSTATSTYEIRFRWMLRRLPSK